MDKEDGGDAEGKLPFLRFVPEEVHPQEWLKIRITRNYTKPIKA